MAWATPPTAVNGGTIQAADANTVRDDLNETAPAKVTTAGDLSYATGANALSRLAIGTVRQELIVNSGATAPQWFTRPAALAYSDIGVALTTGSVVPLAYEEFDNDTIHDNSTNNERLTCKTAGRYLIWGCVTFTGSGGNYRYLSLWDSTGRYLTHAYFPYANGSNYITLWVVTERVLAVNGYVNMEVFHDKGSAISVDNLGCRLGMRWLGPS